MSTRLASSVDRLRAALSHPVVATGLGLVALQAIFRVWALYPSWFYADDYRLMLDAVEQPLSVDYMLEPFDGHFMPLARLVVWVVTQSGPLNWTLAASITVTAQVVAGVLCLWMLLQLFGRRWAVPFLLGLYLTSAIPVPALMWWAASLNQLPMQMAFFAAVGAWARYLSSARVRWLACSVLAVVLGLLFYEKSLLIVPVLAYLAFAYFASGSFLGRLRKILRRYPLGVVLMIALASAYALYYLIEVPQPFEEGEVAKLGEVANTLIGTTFSTGILGGPWRWWETNPPLVLASPPEWSVHAAWVVIVGAIAYSILRRRRSGRAWGLLFSYLGLVFALLATSRGQLYGSLAGLEYRYLTDIISVLVLCIGLAFLEIPGCSESSAPRRVPRITVALPLRIAVPALAVVYMGGLFSSYVYVTYWHNENAGAEYMANLQESADAKAPLQLADAVLPEWVIPEYAEPDNKLSNFIHLLDVQHEFSNGTSQVSVVDDRGFIRSATVNPRNYSKPGPNPDCGWKVDDRGINVPLANRSFEWTWWLRLGYLSSSESRVTITAGESVVDARLASGLNSLFVRVEDGFDHVEIDNLSPGTQVCVDRIDVGELIPLPGE